MFLPMPSGALLRSVDHTTIPATGDDMNTHTHADVQLRRVLLAGLPGTERRLDIAGVTTVVLEAGDGPPLVLLHGGIEVGGSYWAPLIPALAQHYRVIVPDAPGLGESDPVPGAALDQERFDTWFAATIDGTCAEPPAVVAHSLLGTYAARFAVRHGARLRSLVIYGAPGVGPYRMPLGLILTAILFDLRPSLASHRRFARWAFHDPSATAARHPEWFAAFNAYCVSRGKVPHVKRTMRRLVRHGVSEIPRAELAAINLPVALIWGRHDRMAPQVLASHAAAVQGWPLHVIEGAGHVPHLEQPDAFLETLMPVLAEVRVAARVGAA